MKALDRKVLRDLKLLWSQGLTIALVVASGIGGFIASLSAVDSLAPARDQFYEQGRFADVFTTLKRAPDSLLERLREVPGVAEAEATVETTARVSTVNSPDPVVGQLIGAGQPPAATAQPRHAARRPAARHRRLCGRRAGGAGVRRLCGGTRAEGRRAGVGAHQRQAPGASYHRHRAVAGIYFCRSLGHAGPARLWCFLAGQGSAGGGAGHGGRLQPSGAQARAGSVATRRDRRGGQASRLQRRPAGPAPERPGVACHAGQRNPRAARAGHAAAVDLPGGRGLFAACGGRAPGVHPARTDCRAQGPGLRQPQHRPALPQAGGADGRRRLPGGPIAGRLAGRAAHRPVR